MDFESEDICGAFLARKIAPDEALVESHRFLSGPLPIKFSQWGMAITAHEFGHLFQFDLNNDEVLQRNERNRLNRVNQCLAGEHSEIKNYTQRAYRENRRFGAYLTDFSVEDFADLISAKIAKSSDNTICALIRADEQSEYSDLKFNNDGSGDPHSAVFWRLLHIEFLRNGKLPHTCELAASMKNFTPQYRDCWSDGNVP